MNIEQLTMMRANATHAEGIVQLVHACYNDQACSDARLLNPNILAAALQNETLQFYIAQIPSGQIVSMEGCESVPYFPYTAYLKNHMTLPEYRGCGVGRQMCRYLFDHFDFERFYSVLGFAVTCNAISQGIFHRHGGQMTGLLYNSYMKTDDEQNLTPWLPKRSHVIMVKPLAPPPPPPLAIPPALLPLAKSLYASFGFSLQLLESPCAPTGATVATTLSMPDHHNVEMIVEHSGTDLAKLLEPVLRSNAEDPLGTCNLFLNAADPGAIDAYNTLCGLGFVFSGFKPLSHRSEYLVLHHSARLHVAIEDFILHPDFHALKDSLSVFVRREQ